MVIRKAITKEASVLSELAIRSKAFWGYDPAFIEACRDDLTLSEAYIKRNDVFVIEQEEKITGFYSLLIQEKQGILDHLFIHPEAIGKGFGNRLWDHMIQTALKHNLPAIQIHSDPYAEGFYSKMGAVKIGEVASSVFSERKLPLLEYRIKL